MNAPFMHNLRLNMRGFQFIQNLGGAYEYEEEYVRSWILRIAKELKASLEQPELHEEWDVPQFLDALNATIRFLESIPDEFVTMYSYDRAPSINEILDAWREGGGGVDDWALEELEKKGEKGRRGLLSALKKEKNRARRLTALELLIVIFRDDQTRAEVQRFVEASGDDEIRQAARAISEQV